MSAPVGTSVSQRQQLSYIAAQAADVTAEPEGEIASVTGTAEDVEAVADAEADESREADDASQPLSSANQADAAQNADQSEGETPEAPANRDDEDGAS